MKKLDQTGSHIIAVAVGVLVIAVIGFAGYKVMHANDTTTAASGAKTATAIPASIKTTSDLSNTAKALDDSSSQLNASVDGNSLNTDLNTLL